MSEDNPDALPPASYLGDFARAYPNAKLLYRADDPFSKHRARRGLGSGVSQQWEVLHGGFQTACNSPIVISGMKIPTGSLCYAFVSEDSLGFLLSCRASSVLTRKR